MGTRSYLVKWFGYDDPAEDTWEPQKNIANCQRLLASFWAEIGVDNDDYYPGWEGVPSEKWIKKERAFFAANHKDKDRQRRLEAQREREIKEEKKREEKKRKQVEIKSTLYFQTAHRDQETPRRAGFWRFGNDEQNFEEGRSQEGKEISFTFRFFGLGRTHFDNLEGEKEICSRSRVLQFRDTLDCQEKETQVRKGDKSEGTFILARRRGKPCSVEKCSCISVFFFQCRGNYSSEGRTTSAKGSVYDTLVSPSFE
ncbi:hypothetical protein GYMLUDRAFT_425244 [Collybiopsis luxurians FD-317 M1]|uniref:Chromo domain-containing protein n=1 Tax=Collybiopsis luxurians FD-317 M1 TaxID=944289 RepID=A0A0D0C723_9AGAR|nr:hypothetical protein GYMLUDRAFT_425244 [Collybiopsis luxurians FD-317 M1]